MRPHGCGREAVLRLGRVARLCAVPRACREFLRALVAVNLGIGMRKVDVKTLNEAYTKAFPHSSLLNVGKMKPL